ncbi:MAG TPA: hypothetical protein VNM45_21080 [Bacillus sp. (in: firmicutes)]|nr:hypothetical protein [Bacillus sp. (in: firmicutes)]
MPVQPSMKSWKPSKMVWLVAARSLIQLEVCHNALEEFTAGSALSQEEKLKE